MARNSEADDVITAYLNPVHQRHIVKSKSDDHKYHHIIHGSKPGRNVDCVLRV